MDIRISVITLGVENMDRALGFYRGAFGWQFEGDRSGVAYCSLGDVTFALYPREALAAYANVPPGGEGFAGVTFSINVAAQEEVDRLLVQANRAGAHTVRPPGPAEWGGHIAWLSDPDHHLWELVWNPSRPGSRDGTRPAPSR